MMDSEKISKYLSYILRHNPAAANLELDHQGWADLQELILNSDASYQLTKEKIMEVVATSDKKRFALSDDHSKIRANQGHSINVDLKLEEAVPPELLYHGTATRFLANIEREGLLPMKRHHVHLTRDVGIARQVGSRYGIPVILAIRSGEMHRQGIPFYRSQNGVWLTEKVTTEFIQIEQ